jgi:hypothetical protein
MEKWKTESQSQIMSSFTGEWCYSVSATKKVHWKSSDQHQMMKNDEAVLPVGNWYSREKSIKKNILSIDNWTSYPLAGGPSFFPIHPLGCNGSTYSSLIFAVFLLEGLAIINPQVTSYLNIIVKPDTLKLM